MRKAMSISSKMFLVLTMMAMLVLSCVCVSAEDAAIVQSDSNVVAIDLDYKPVPKVIGPYVMENCEDTRDENEEIDTIPTILGDIITSENGDLVFVYYWFFENSDGEIYFFNPEIMDDGTASIELTLPEGVKAIAFRVIAESVSPANITAETNDGTKIESEYYFDDEDD